MTVRRKDRSRSKSTKWWRTRSWPTTQTHPKRTLHRIRIMKTMMTRMKVKEIRMKMTKVSKRKMMAMMMMRTMTTTMET